MNKKYIIAAFIFVICALLGLSGAVQYRRHHDAAEVLGHYALEQARQKLPLMTSIRIKTPQNGEISLYRKENYWRFHEAADYFINNKTLTDFYDFINNAVITDVYPASAEKIAELHNGIEIQILDDNENKLAHLWLAEKADTDNMHTMQLSDSNYIFRVNHTKPYFGEPQAWIPMPLLQIKNETILGIDYGSQFLDREILIAGKKQFEFIRNLLTALNYTLYEGIISRQDFFSSHPDITPKTLQIYISGGLIYVLHLYNINNTIWLTIDLKTQKITRQEMAVLVQNMQPYYADWVFQLNAEQGTALLPLD